MVGFGLEARCIMADMVLFTIVAQRRMRFTDSLHTARSNRERRWPRSETCAAATLTMIKDYV